MFELGSVQGWAKQGNPGCIAQLDLRLTVKQGGCGMLGMREASLGRPKDEMPPTDLGTDALLER